MTLGGPHVGGTGQLRSAVAVKLYRAPRLKLLIQSVLVALSAYFSAILAATVADTYTKGAEKLGIQAAGVVAVTAVVIFVVRIVGASGTTRLSKRATVLAMAHSQIDGCTSIQLDHICSAAHVGAASVIPFDPLDAIKHLVKALYTCMDSHYGAGDVPGERVNFEATFMTLDHADREVTIIAWASRDGRAPKSLAERQRNRRLYSTSVTADLYREAETQQVRTRITPDTSKGDYAELYPGQKQRIRSSIVRPVLSASNALLGTLVLHCDQPNFFHESDAKYWNDLMDVFGIRIALHKAQLDWLHERESKNASNDVHHGMTAPSPEQDPASS